MKVIDPGHRYFLDGLKSSEGQYLQFYKDAEINGDGYSGCSSQEVLRSLIDRVKFLETQKSAPENEEIVLESGNDRTESAYILLYIKLSCWQEIFFKYGTQDVNYNYNY